VSERVVVTREFVAALLAVLSEARNECEASLSPSAQALVPRIAEIEDTAEGVLVDADYRAWRRAEQRGEEGAVPPCHLRIPGRRDALCGERDPLPVVSVHHAHRHVVGHGLELCPECSRRLL